VNFVLYLYALFAGFAFGYGFGFVAGRATRRIRRMRGKPEWMLWRDMRRG